MTTNNKTLANVQPGGRVRLGDALPPLPQMGYEARGTGMGPHDVYYTPVAYTAEQMRDYARAALSAQPSPGGQGDALLESLVARWRNHAEEIGVSDNLLCQKIAKCTIRHAAELQAALAARQPVGEPVAWMTHHDEPMLFPTAAEAAAYCEDDEQPVPLFRSPAQAVDLAQEPVFYIQDTRQYVGNCPVWWGPNGSGYVTRLDEAGRYTEQEAVKQNRCRETDIPWPCAEIEAIARRTVDFQHMRPRAERLAELAQVDSKAVGNG